MFTGLIQGLGRLTLVSQERLQVNCLAPTARKILTDLEVGDSVAVDGVCLTVTGILAEGFIADVSPETLNRSTLAQAEAAIANLETSLRVGSKIGGHFVTGHVDGMGRLQQTIATANAWEMTFATLSAPVARYIVPKGSIAVNGVSLTIADCAADGSWFTVAVIPLTYAETNLSHLQEGAWVNLEGDILGKYVERLLRLQVQSPERALTNTIEDLSPTFLAEHGYL